MKTTVIFGLGCIALIVAGSVWGDDIRKTDKKIDWYGTLESGLAEAQRVNKPVFLLAAAPQCLGVPGIW